MLKVLFWLLLLANGVLLALHQGYLGEVGGLGREQHEPARAGRQLRADRLRLLDEASARARAAPLFAAAAPKPAEDAPPPTMACIEIGDFGAADGARFAARLEALGLQDKASAQAPHEGAAGYMVYLAAPADGAALERRKAELRQLGIEEFFILPPTAALPGAISLGVFKTEERAQGQLAALQKKGLRGVRIQARAGAGRQAFRLRGLERGQQATFEQLRAEFPAQQTRPCEPADADADPHAKR